MTRARQIVVRSIVAAACLSLAVDAAAQTPPTTPPVQGRAGAPARGAGAGRGQRQNAPVMPNANMAPAEVDRIFDTYALFQAKDALKLDNQVWLSFGPKYQQLQQVRHQHQMARRRLIAQINDLLKPPAAGAEAVVDDATVAARTKSLDDLEAQILKDEQAALAGIDQMLTVRQRARFRVFLDTMERKKAEMIVLAKQQAQNKEQAAAVLPKLIK